MDDLMEEVRRNTRVLIALQVITSLSIQTVVALGPLVMFSLTGSPILAGLVSAITWGGRLAIVYQSGILMDRFGRRNVLLAGIAPMTLGSIMMIYSVLTENAGLLIGGLAVFGIGVGIAQQNRVAMTDMYPPESRGFAIGKLYTASVIGSFVAPIIAWAGEVLGANAPLRPTAVTWVMMTLLIASMVPVLRSIRVDPKEIALLLNRKPSVISMSNGVANAEVRVPRLPLIAAYVTSAAAQGNMVMLMGLASLYLHDLGYSQTLVSLAVSVHVIGMYGLSTLFGRLADRAGRPLTIMIGQVVAGLGAMLIPLTTNHVIVDVGMFLIGLGWSATTVASTALISDIVPPSIRGKYFGLNDLFLGVSAVSMPIVGGVVVASLGFSYLGLLGLVVTLGTAPLVHRRLGLIREVQPTIPPTRPPA
ncbi:MAG: MFS transporter [Nitrososphaerota archaeon]|nr:MFS transporter [Candidatus Calditenuis fumarioli]